MSAAASGRPRKAQQPVAARGAPAKARNGKGSKLTPPGQGGGGLGLSAVPKAGKELARDVSPKPSSLKGKAALKLAKVLAHRTFGGGADAVSEISRQGLDRGFQALGSLHGRVIAAASTSVDIEATNRPPIQCAVDAGVPTAVAWSEWMRLEWLPEGVDRVGQIKRKRDGKLTGRLQGDRGRAWAAEVLDEREQESFAWESVTGSDCAGLVTFHELGERLTRIELSLDVHPVSVVQAAALSTRLADRRAVADLRRFKARLELINPDLYADANSRGD